MYSQRARVIVTRKCVAEDKGKDGCGRTNLRSSVASVPDVMRGVSSCYQQERSSGLRVVCLCLVLSFDDRWSAGRSDKR